MNPLKLQIVIDAQNKTDAIMKEVSGQFSKLNEQIDALQPAFGAMAAAGTAAFVGVAAIAGSAVAGFIADQKDMTLATGILQTAFDNLTSEGVKNLHDELGKGPIYFSKITDEMTKAADAALKLGYDDETASIAFAKLFAVSNDVSQSQEDLKLAMDLAAFSGKDLATATQAVITIHAGGTKVLKEFGIEAEEGATAADVLALAQQRVGGTAEKMAETTTVQIERMKLQWENIKSAVGGVIVEALDPLIQKLVPLIEKVTAWAEENPKLIATIMAIVAAGGLLVAGLGFLGLAVPAVTAGLATLGITAATVGTAFTILTGPVGLVIAAIAALIAVGVLLYKHWDEVKAFAASTWEAIKEGISTALDGILNVMNSVWKTIQDVFWFGVDFMIGVIKAFLDFFFPGWEATFTAIWNTTVAIFEGIKSAISSALQWLLNTIITPILNAIKSVWDTIWGGISSAFSSLWEGIKSAAGGALDWIKEKVDALKAPLESIISMAQKAIDLAKKIGGGVAKAVSSVVSSGSSVTGRAIGGPVGTNHGYMVGENGPEFFMPGVAGRIVPNGGLGGGAVYLTITGNTFMGKEDIAQEIGDSILDIIKKNIKL